MPSSQLEITGSFGAEIERRRARIEEQQDRARMLLNKWRDEYGIDTPVPIDRGWHQLAVTYARRERRGLSVDSRSDH